MTNNFWPQKNEQYYKKYGEDDILLDAAIIMGIVAAVLMVLSLLLHLL